MEIAKVYKELSKDVFRYCMFHLHNRESAEDCTSEVFTRWIATKGAPKAMDDLKPWLIGVARNVIREKYREISKANLESSNIEVPDNLDIEGEILSSELVEMIKQELDKLDDTTREVIILKVWEDFTFKQISQVTEETESNCKLLYYRGLEKIKVAMGERQPSKKLYAALPLPILAGTLKHLGSATEYSISSSFQAGLVQTAGLSTNLISAPQTMSILTKIKALPLPQWVGVALVTGTVVTAGAVGIIATNPQGSTPSQTTSSTSSISTQTTTSTNSAQTYEVTYEDVVRNTSTLITFKSIDNPTITQAVENLGSGPREDGQTEVTISFSDKARLVINYSATGFAEEPASEKTIFNSSLGEIKKTGREIFSGETTYFYYNVFTSTNLALISTNKSFEMGRDLYLSFICYVKDTADSQLCDSVMESLQLKEEKSLPVGWEYYTEANCGIGIPVPPKATPYIYETTYPGSTTPTVSYWHVNEDVSYGSPIGFETGTWISFTSGISGGDDFYYVGMMCIKGGVYPTLQSIQTKVQADYGTEAFETVELWGETVLKTTTQTPKGLYNDYYVVKNGIAFYITLQKGTVDGSVKAQVEETQLEIFNNLKFN